tara:strand:+ start:548 stop:1411 length:864 start_codon:yes stop_codon:yes gene_type:complete
MKPETFFGSIEKGKDKLYVSSNQTIACINGAFVKLANNDIFYRAESVEDLNIKRKFIIFKESLLIKGNFVHKLFANDTVSVTFPEHEAESAKLVSSPLSNITEGETFFAQGGAPSSSPSNITGKYAEIKITNIDGDTPVLTVVDAGRYIIPPTNPVSLMNEEGITIQADIEFDLSSNASILERDITDVAFNGEKTTINLSYPIPDGVEEGEIVVSKQAVNLNKNYYGETLDAELCQITFDYSPLSGIPLLPPNSIDPQSTYNEAIEIIERKFRLLEERVKKLETLNY